MERQNSQEIAWPLMIRMRLSKRGSKEMKGRIHRTKGGRTIFGDLAGRPYETRTRETLIKRYKRMGPGRREVVLRASPLAI
jgi:hypothetical protein